MKILLTGGGTGGHLIPLLGVVSELKKLSNVCNKAPQPYRTMEPANGAEKKLGKPEFLLITPASGFNQNISDAGIKIKTIKAGKLRRYFSLENIIDIFKIPVGIIQSLYHIHKFKPDMVFSKGGFASIPPVIAAWVLRVPIVTHESDIVPGLANRIIARFASKVLISFSATEKYFNKNKVILTGNPVRSDIVQGNRENALEFFKLSPDLPTILIFGGSQGAQKVNEMVLEILPKLVKRCQVIHQCGTKNYDKIKSKIDIKTGVHFLKCKEFNSNETSHYRLKPEFQNRYHLYPYLNKEMKDAYAIADVVVSRAGANSISEIAALKKPNILIPLSAAAGNHQFKNAEFFVEKGASLIINETVNSSQDLANAIFRLLSDKDLQDEIKQKLSEMTSSQNAASKIAGEILKCRSLSNSKI